ncbi:MAG: hypothetical protein QOF17_81 [Solirubrobacteraceae bacterium]|jgi:short subunit dehydrogenase-like uncharacterized protein|nr:hypothetical protein [Solirubrobacteraceae bacterium]
MASRIVVFGATGYTGTLVAQRLVALGERPVLAGRSAARLDPLAERLGGLETAIADVARPGTVFDLLGEGDVIVSTVGPFAKWGDPAVRAAIAAAGTYIDSTGEPAFIRRVFEELGPAARRAGATLLTAMGYDFVPGALAGALALEEAGEDAVRVDVGYYALGAGAGAMSAGTKASSVGIVLDPAHTFRDGRLQTVRSGERVRAFDVKGRERPALSIGAAEHFSLPAAYPRLREVNVHLGWFGPLARALQGASLATGLLTRVPGARGALRSAGERLVGLTSSPEPGETSEALSWIVAEALDAGGRPLAEVHLSGADPYRYTGDFMAWAAQRAAQGRIEGTGALGPVEALGLEALQAGCADAGLERVSPPVAA